MPMRPLSQRDYYTTGEMAAAAGVTQNTIIRRIDAGTLLAYRLPNGIQRRCSKVTFRRYLADHGIPSDTLDELERRESFRRSFRRRTRRG